ncbi:MAG: hypothetical protein PWQ67_1083 [Clostridia bacterium]|jgi:hypothetical protein|nr:hypothetical protein [Clostridia bacterium]MDN5322629.1 hypothetical protein [Clostridia bacterium]
MAKNKYIEVIFPKLGHFWLDSGLVGLIKIGEEIQYMNNNLVYTKVQDNNYIIKGQKENVHDFLWKCSTKLMEDYYNVSSKTQIEKNEAIVFNTLKNKFERHPKRGTFGLSKIIFNAKASAICGKMTVKKGEIIVEDEYKQYENQLRNFLTEENVKLTYSNNKISIPFNMPFYYRPIKKEDIKLENSRKKSKNSCFFCGEDKQGIFEIGGPIFPFITGINGLLSFNSNAKKPERVCWKCSLLGKFVPVNGFYFSQDDHLYAFLPYSSSLEKMCNTYDSLQVTKEENPNLYNNFKHPLGYYYQSPFEVFFAFLYTIYDKLSIRQISKVEDEIEFDLNKIFDLTFHEAPLEFIVIHSKKEKDTFASKMIWSFKETVYYYRIIKEIEKRMGISIKEPLNYLVDETKKNKSNKNQNITLLRNRVCERILKKQPILDLIEQHVFHAQLDYFKPLLEMLLTYEQLIKGEDEVYRDEQEAAVNLGRRIGMAVAKNVSGKKGDLFALRKTRRKVDFLEQINRLQFKLGNEFIVPSNIYEGKLRDDNFLEFKQFCMIAALNSYNFAKNGENTTKKEDKKL